MSADRFKRAAKANSSGSWNKYTYTRGDPVNRFDQHGTEDCSEDEPCPYDPCEEVGLCDDPGGPAPDPGPGPATTDCNALTAAAGFAGLTYAKASEIWGCVANTGSSTELDWHI